MDHLEQLKSYIYQQIQSGVNPDEISAQLRTSGWDEASITAAFQAVQAQIVPTNPSAAPAHTDSTDKAAASPAVFQANGKKRGRIKTAWLLMKQSLKVLKNNKELLRYPFMGGLICLLFTVLIVGIFILAGDSLYYTALNNLGEEEAYPTAAGMVVGITYYILSFFIIFTYNAGLAAHVLDIFRGKSQDYKHYMSIAWSKKKPIFVYSLITTTVGIILNIIEERAAWLGWLISRVLGALWKLANLFTIPVIVETDSSAPSAIKQSTQLFVSRWGENIAARITFGGIMFLLYLLIVIPVFIVLGIVLGAIGPAGWIIFLILLVASIILLATLEVAASNVLSTALYFYAKYGQVPPAFSAELLNSTLIPKKKRRFFGKKETPAPATP